MWYRKDGWEMRRGDWEWRNEKEPRYQEVDLIGIKTNYRIKCGPHMWRIDQFQKHSPEKINSRTKGQDLNTKLDRQLGS